MPHSVGRVYRQRLFSGGLRMFVQPLVNLRDSTLVKVEALARLIMPDGTVVGTGTF